MFPLRDSQPSSRWAVVTYSIIVLNVLLFLVELSLGEHLSWFILHFGFVPRNFLLYIQAGDAAGMLIPMFTSMFLQDRKSVV